MILFSRTHYRKSVAVVWLLLSVHVGIAQEDTTDVHQKISTPGYSKFVPIPLFSSAPETSLRIGVIGVYFFRFKNSDESTQLSSIRAPQSYTLRNQVKFRISNDIFFNRNEHIISGFAEWLRFPLFFFGIGANTSNDDKEIYTSRVLNISYNYLKKINNIFYGGFRFDRRDSKIQEIVEGGQLDQDVTVPGAQGGISQGIGLVGRLDTRDNLLCTNTGYLHEFTLTTYNEAFGSDFEFTKLAIDSRFFSSVNQGKHVLAGQVYLEQNWGSPSFETLALMGGPFLMRGNFEGRFRDRSMWATQWEYRLPFGRVNYIDEDKSLKFWHRFGMTTFLGVGSVQDDLLDGPFDDLKLTGGVGLRFLVFPEERINLRIDAGFGTETPALYIFIREAF